MATRPHVLENIKLARMCDGEKRKKERDSKDRGHPFVPLPSAKLHLLKFPKIVPPSEDQSTHKTFLGGAEKVRGSSCQTTEDICAYWSNILF